jgi:hypothetical protein
MAFSLQTDTQAPLVGEISANFGVYRGVGWSAQWVAIAVNRSFLECKAN